MIRTYQKSDDPFLHEMLISEGWKDFKLYQRYPTYVMIEKDEIIGFMTIKQSYDLPSIQHLIIKKDKRDGKRWKQFFKLGKDIIQKQGKKAGLIMAPIEKPYLKKFIEKLPNIKLYNQNDKGWYYILEVN